jgi:hypothetical protein
MLRVVATFVMVILGGEALACPGDPVSAPAVHLSARQLATPRSAEVRAGGTVALETCLEVSGFGYVPFAPTAVLHFTDDRRGHALVIRAEAACTPMLLVETARGNRYVSAQGASPDGARLVIANPISGRYAIWVGTRDVFGCDARLVVRSARPTRAGLRTAIR